MTIEQIEQAVVQRKQTTISYEMLTLVDRNGRTRSRAGLAKMAIRRGPGGQRVIDLSAVQEFRTRETLSFPSKQ